MQGFLCNVLKFVYITYYSTAIFSTLLLIVSIVFSVPIFHLSQSSPIFFKSLFSPMSPSQQFNYLLLLSHSTTLSINKINLCYQLFTSPIWGLGGLNIEPSKRTYYERSLFSLDQRKCFCVLRTTKGFHVRSVLRVLTTF